MHLVDQTDQRLVHQLGFLVAQQAFRGFVAALHDAFRRSHQHGIAQAVEHRVQIIFRDRGFIQLLAHALQCKLQVAEFVVADHRQGPRIVALADSIGALHQSGDGSRQLPGDEPGARQS